MFWFSCNVGFWASMGKSVIRAETSFSPLFWRIHLEFPFLFFFRSISDCTYFGEHIGIPSPRMSPWTSILTPALRNTMIHGKIKPEMTREAGGLHAYILWLFLYTLFPLGLPSSAESCSTYINRGGIQFHPSCSVDKDPVNQSENHFKWEDKWRVKTRIST